MSVAPAHDDGGRAALVAALAGKIAAVGDEPGHRGGRATGRRQAGASDRTAVGARAGGHPEDDPGDPSSVAKSICLRMLTGAPRSRATLEEALRRKEIPDDIAAAVLDRLTEVGLIDDQAYAEAFVATKQRDRGLGRTALRTELRRKGIDPETAASVVATIDPDAEYERAAILVRRRIDSAMAAGPVAAKRRLVGLLARRGYGPSVAYKVVDEALAEYGIDPDDQ